MLGRPLWPNHHAGLSILFLFPRIQSLLWAPVCLLVLTPSLVLGGSDYDYLNVSRDFNPVKYHP